MKDNFDKILRDKIKEVTENRDLPYNPEHWKMLVAKKNRNKKRTLFYWRFAAFLVLSLFVGGLGKFLFDKSYEEKPTKQELIIDDKNDSLRKNNLKKDENILITESDIDSLKSIETRVTQIDSASIKTKFNSKFNTPLETDKTGNANRITQNKQKKQKTEIDKTNLLADKAIALKDSIKNDSLIHIDDLLLKNEKIVQNISDIKRDTLSNNNFIVNLEETLKKDSLNIKKELIAELEEENSNEKMQRKPIKIGVNLSPIFNSNQESENSNIGFAGGVSVEIPISNKFDIYTGIIYTNQKFNLQQQTNILADGVSAKNESQLILEEAVITGIEIPINIKYNFTIAKKNLFVSAGVSSTSNFKENIEANYIVNDRTQTSLQDSFGNSIIQYELVQTYEKVVTPNGSNNFNFASILNMSLGVEFPMNKGRQSIIVEPYFKYSLKPVTQQKVNFSSAGIFLRYNFTFERN